MKIKCVLGLVVLLCVLLSFLKSAEAGGLSTEFGEVVLENLHIGKSYSIRKTARLPLDVANTSDYSVELKIDILIPQDNELKDGYEPIPDKSWIELEQDFFRLEPYKHAVTDVIISIPDDEQYLEKKYQVYIWSHTINGRIGMGLKSRLLFSITSQDEDNN